jgi:hypothetical protein
VEWVPYRSRDCTSSSARASSPARTGGMVLAQLRADVVRIDRAGPGTRRSPPRTPPRGARRSLTTTRSNDQETPGTGRPWGGEPPLATREEACQRDHHELPGSGRWLRKIKAKGSNDSKLLSALTNNWYLRYHLGNATVAGRAGTKRPPVVAACRQETVNVIFLFEIEGLQCASRSIKTSVKAILSVILSPLSYLLLTNRATVSCWLKTSMIRCES